MMERKSGYVQWSKEELLAHIEKIEQQRKYGLVWDEERVQEEFESQSLTSLPVLQPIPSHSVSLNPNQPTHILIEGDNLHALSVLNYTHENAVDLIYIDPPYNRGLRDSNDFRYNDKYIDRSDTFRHSKWLSFMAKRLLAAKTLLKESGAIFVSIDDHELAQLKLLMDDIFGEENYKNTILLRRGAKNVQAQFDTIDKLSSGYEYVLFYSKTPNQRFAKMVKELAQTKPGAWNNHWRGTDRPTMRYELFGITPQTGQWRWGRARSLAAIENYQLMLQEIGGTENELTASKIDAWFLAKSAELGEEVDLLRLSVGKKPEHYIPPTDTTLLNDVWFDISPNSTSILKSIFGKKVFDNPKPLELIKRISKFVGRDAVVLDFFAGSGTTAHALLEMNEEDGGQRQIILVTNNENDICTEVCYPRFKKILAGYENSRGVQVKGFGGNLKYFRASFAKNQASEMLNQCTDLLCLKHGIYTLEKESDAAGWKIFSSLHTYLAVCYRVDDEALEALRVEMNQIKAEKILYCFTTDPAEVNACNFSNWENLRVLPVPPGILNLYRRSRS